MNDKESSELKDITKLTAKKNMDVLQRLVRDWNLGPKVGIDNNQGNLAYWSKMLTIWDIKLDEARRRSCANCEYGRIKPDYLKEMGHVPYNNFDKDGGMRVWCTKFDFICHATRVCQNWEDDD